MVDDPEDLEDLDADDYVPSAEEEKAARDAIEMAERYPLFVLITKALQRHKRMHRLIDLAAPQQILDREKELREKAFDELANAIPFDHEINSYHLADVINTLAFEIRRPHDKGGSDA